MKYIICLVISLIYVQYSPNAYSQEGKSVYLKQGTPAPFNGILLDSQAQAEMIANSEYKKKECELKSQYELLKTRVGCDLEVGKLKIDIDIAQKKYDTIMTIKDTEIKRVNDIAMKENNKSDRWIWWLAGGVLTGVALTIATTYAVNR